MPVFISHISKKGSIRLSWKMYKFCGKLSILMWTYGHTLNMVYINEDNE